MEAGMENQKVNDTSSVAHSMLKTWQLATDASALMKHYKALLLL